MPYQAGERQCFVPVGCKCFTWTQTYKSNLRTLCTSGRVPGTMRRRGLAALQLVRQKERHRGGSLGRSSSGENSKHTAPNEKTLGGEFKDELSSSERQVTSWDRQRTAISVAAGLLVGLIFFGTKGTDRGMEYVAAYVVEQSLSVDNLFVFLLLFRFFRVPKNLQEKVLSYGILGAAVFRAIFVFTGVALMERFRTISLVFAAILLISSGRMLWSSFQDSEADDESNEEGIRENFIVRAVTALLPVSDDYDGDRFFTSLKNGATTATPLLLVLVCVELTDVIFALDSVPACLGISRDPLVVYVSNLMAIVGLRSWYFVIQEAIRNFRYIEQTLAVVLGFIGSKLALGYFGYEASTTISLSVILGTLAVGYSAGFVFSGTNEKS
ncbi:similar to tellurium resistance protein TerC [Cyanidioschyzon merolae strain 10D]|jgi:TerC family integral membrane protein|uniref:Similar to tellurium resistance protein TerC n=1 Tax=Cyanidioschyzon merolae (strain NIES-3377 / 10D) TaxID=280699 RepID=M1VE00_CYAM1|nr:similar to tellurium resistance protein TerC [Cyanidioschyzon merolae strain 10D]BAM81107.1 similar to tellurium resistance protein TerC [Cyanidioschyzon merolae strain 10D]|eukprot:XP_005537143.1 similar to tellurium resistance protein TerC [Cyanidioschyzon merolae strain 10D]